MFLLPAGGASPTEDRTFGVRRKPAPAFLPFEQLDSPPAAVVQAMPRFPAALIGHVDRGWAEVDFLVDESGRVRVPVVRSESAREFGDAALAVISRWRFTAPRRHGRPVVAAAGWRFEFEPAAPRAEDAK